MKARGLEASGTKITTLGTSKMMPHAKQRDHAITIGVGCRRGLSGDANGVIITLRNFNA